MNLTLDLEAEFFRSPDMPLVCLATGATKNVELFPQQLPMDYKQVRWFHRERITVQVPYARSLMEFNRVRTKRLIGTILALIVMTCCMAIGLEHIVRSLTDSWYVLGLCGTVWLALFGFFLFQLMIQPVVQPEIQLIDEGRKIRVVFQPQGRNAWEKVRRAHEIWQETHALQVREPVSVDDWADDVPIGWDEGGKKP